jgi:hypothetical protein
MDQLSNLHSSCVLSPKMPAIPVILSLSRRPCPDCTFQRPDKSGGTQQVKSSSWFSQYDTTRTSPSLNQNQYTPLHVNFILTQQASGVLLTHPQQPPAALHQRGQWSETTLRESIHQMQKHDQLVHTEQALQYTHTFTLPGRERFRPSCQHHAFTRKRKD